MTSAATPRTNLLGLPRPALEAFVAQLGSQPFRARQLMNWMYKRGVGSFADMTDLAREFRTRLTAQAEVRAPQILSQQRSGDGSRKWLLRADAAQAFDLVGFYTGTGTARTLTSPDRAAVLAYVQTKAPFQVSGTGGGLRVLTTVADPQRVEITLTANGITAFSFDWIDSVPLVVLSWTSATRALRMTTALPASLRAGHRLTIDGQVGGSGVNAQDGREFRIESISAADTVILEVAPPVAPGATDKVYSGGPLVTPIRDAIAAHLNGEIVYAGRGLTPIPESKAAPIDPFGPSIIGLDELVQGIGSSNPAGAFGSWSGGIVLSQLFKIATYKAGVRKANIIAPVADYEPVNDGFPVDNQIHYVVPSAIIIRSV